MANFNRGGFMGSGFLPLGTRSLFSTLVCVVWLLVCIGGGSSEHKTERPPYENFLNYGVKKIKPTHGLGNEIIKSKVEVLGDVLKKHVDKLRKSPRQNVELVFLVDSSASVGAENFFNELKFVKKLLADFTVSYNETRVAVVTFSSKSKVFRHIDHVTQASFSNHKCSLLERELPQIRYTGGGTYTLGALMEAQSVLALSRPDAVKAVFLVTDGYSNGGDPRPAAEFLKGRGVIVFTFGIQNGNVKELYDMASVPKEEHSYILESFEEFEALARRALHEDLHSGMMISQDVSACSTLCPAGGNCCDQFARCTCGTHTGHFTCTCRIGYYGTGLQGDCKPCPSGTYRDEEGPSDLKGCKACPDSNMLSPEGSTSPHQCYCSRGYTQMGLQCQRLQCAALSPPPNGYFVRNSCERAVNAACGIRCHPGYTLEGSSIRLCREDGTWSGGDATCVMKRCKLLEAPTNGNMICTSKTGTIDTQCHFTCKPGYQLVGSKMRTCLPVAMWDGIRAYCKPIFCPPLSLNKNGFVKPESCSMGKIKYGTRCEFGCNQGYQLSGPLKTTCSDKGLWTESHQKVRCIDVDPPIIRCPRNMEVTTEPNENYAMVTWEPPAVRDSSGGRVDVTTVPATKQPMKLKIGQQMITFVAKDEWGNGAKCIMAITVKDEEPPKIDSCVSPPTFLSRDMAIDVYWEEPVFSDNSGVPVKISRSKDPGRFPQGETIVTYTAVDPFGNSASCDIYINVQQHACELPVDPVNGVANCTENPEAVYCTLTCTEGYAFALRPNQDYFCAYDGVWHPDSNPLPFPDCAVSSISNTISHTGEIAMKDEDGSVCDDIFFMGQVENKIQQKLEEALSEVCADELLCEIATVEAVCEGLLAEAEEEFNSISFYRKKRDLTENQAQRWFRKKEEEDDDVFGWMYWTRGQPVPELSQLRRRKRAIPNPLNLKRQFGFPSEIFRGREANGTASRILREEKGNFMGVLTGLIIQSLGKDIGMTRFSSFLSSLGSEKKSMGVNDFLAAFAKEFGEEKTNDLRTLAEKRLGGIIEFDPDVEDMSQRFSVERGLHVSQTNITRFGGMVHTMQGEDGQQYSNQDDLGFPSFPGGTSEDHRPLFFPGQSLEKIPEEKPKNDGKEIKIKFQVEGQGPKAVEMMNKALGDVLKSAEKGLLDINFGQKQISVAAIRLSEDPEYKCDPGMVVVDQSCVKCPVGTFFNVIAKECQSCPAGSYQTKEGQVSCIVCPENTSTKEGQAKSEFECKAMCLPGSHSSDTLEPCITCPIGEYQDEYASSSCSSCPFGTTTWRRGSWVIDECKPECPPGQISETGLEPCLSCPRNYFQSETGQKVCIKCPGESQTEDVGAIALLNCSGISENSQAAYTSLETLSINDCFSDPCLNGGECQAMESGYSCDCPQGYTGEQCQTDVDECLSDPCLNNGTCEDALGTFHCICAAGFEGNVCDININDCSSQPCLNNASCVDLVDGFKCLCESGFTGEACEENIDECETAPCAENSTCVDGVSNYECVCAPGFDGRHCDTDINDCDSSPCLHGRCTDLVDDFRCTCEPGYTGKECNVDINDCESNPCENNGTCNDWLNGFSCVCPPGYTGKSCETQMSTDFVLEFPSSGIVNYASLNNLPRKLTETTVCFWMKTKDRENYGTPFSYATELHDNALTLTDYSGFVFYVNGERRITDVYANDGIWHLICVTWRSEGGTWTISMDGKEMDSGENLSKGKPIEADGVFIIGQEQDQRGGKYSAPESFIGELALLNVWGKVLPQEQITSLYEECGRYDGDVRSWPDFQSGIMGYIKLKSSTFCRGCGIPNTPRHASLNREGTSSGEVARVTCDEGYKLYQGDAVRTCLVNGKWSGKEPECRAVSCGFPGQLRNGEVRGMNYNYGNVVSLTCNKGFRLLGSSERTCKADGKWSGEEPECQIIQCTDPVPMENGKIISHLGSYLPTNRISYACEEGFQMDGPGFRVCGNSGSWEGEVPSCQPKTCQNVPKIPNADLTPVPDDFGRGHLSVTCNSGFKLEGLSKVLCLEDGSWQKPLPKCQKANCEKPPAIENGNFKVRVSLQGKQAKYKCDPGFVLEGPKLITCKPNGEWDSPSWPKCLVQACPTPKFPENGVPQDKSRWSVGDEVFYECRPGFSLRGSSSKVCLKGFEEGYWEGETPTCQAIMCSTPAAIESGSYSINEPPTDHHDQQSVAYPEGEIEIFMRRRRSATPNFEFQEERGFPSIGHRIPSDDEFPSIGHRIPSDDEFPSISNRFSSENGFPSFPSEFGGSYGQESQSFGSSNYDQNGIEDFGTFTQESGFDDPFDQKVGYSDYESFSQNSYDDFGQTPDGLDVFSYSPDEEIFQTSGFDYSQSQIPDSLPKEWYAYGTVVEYKCKTGYKLIGSPERKCDDSGDWDNPEPYCYQQHCSDLETIENGYLSYFGSGEASRVEFYCNDGYRLVGDFELVCQKDKTWLGTVPKCEMLNCEAPNEPENGTVSFDSTTYRSIATYDCFQGFVLEGNFERHCGAAGFWNGTTPRCIEVVCGTPNLIDYGYIYYEGNLNVGSLVEYGCNECYKLIGASERECLIDESWSLIEPSCELIMCDHPPTSIENGKVIGADNSCGSLVEYECNPGYELIGIRKASCMEDGQWTSNPPTCEKITCVRPPYVANGRQKGYSFKYLDQVSYECNKGYEMQGNSILTCTEKRTWSGSLPVCKIVSCSEPETPSRAKISIDGLFYESKIRIKCDPGFTVEGQDTLTCQADKTWDYGMPTCVPIMCSPPPLPLYALYNSSQFQFESFTYLKYECEEGYVTNVKDTTLKCNDIGLWEGDVIECNPVNCGKPSFFSNGVIAGGQFSLGNVIRFTCLEGYELIGSNISQCMPTGEWSNKASCERINCGSPPLISFGEVTIEEPQGDFNTSSRYYCQRGYLLNGSSKMTCQDDGSWDGEPPTCTPVLCPEPPKMINGVITGNVYEYGNNISYSCNDGFSLKGDSTLFCLENGVWSTDFSVCEMIVCDKPEDIPNAKWKIKIENQVIAEDEVDTSRLTYTHKPIKSTGRKFSKTSKLTSLLENQFEEVLYKFNHRIEYTCNEGYFKTTSGILECTENGWHTTPPQCHPITCPLPIQVKNGHVIGTDVSFGSILKYECDEGFDLFGVSTRKCQANKKWTDIEPYCRPKECPRPSQLVNGKTIAESIKYQSVISYVCDPGFKLMGNETRVCQDDENWSGERPFCEEIFCEPPPDIHFGVTDVNKLKVGGRVTYSCRKGHRMEGKASMNCQSNGLWDGSPPACVQIDCGPAPLNANLKASETSTIYGSKVTYSCDRGYNLEGTDTASCLESGRWSSEAPRCFLVTCDSPPAPTHGKLVKKQKEKEREELVHTKKGKTNRKSKTRQRKKTSKIERLQRGEVYFVDEVIDFECEPGWQISGMKSLSCTQEGTWSGTPPTCKRISCEAPTTPINAKFYGNNFLFEAEVVYSCDKGHVLRGNPVLRCGEDGSWTGTLPSCEPIHCGAPPTVPDAHVTYKVPAHGLPHHYGAVVTYACDEGFLLQGSLYLTCESSGKWIGNREPPMCMEMRCENPPPIPHASAVEDPDARPQIATYTCDPGYVLKGEESVHCSLGRWKGLNITCNPLTCNDPVIPANGKITADNFLLGSTANYSCILGYELKGNPSVVCDVTGKWTGEIPRCLPVDCGEPEIPHRGKVKFYSSLFGAEAEFSCEEGYELKGTGKRVCTAAGTWSDHLPQCRRMTCGEILPPERGFVIGVGQLYSDQVKFSCNKGHVLIGNETSVCLANGSWSVTNPKCEGVKCGSPLPIPNGALLEDGSSRSFVYGEEVVYSCHGGHLPRGDLASTCEKDGTWSPVKGQCSKISCGRPKLNKDGAVILGRSFYYKDKVRVKCPQGMKTRGSTLLTCQSDGSWSGEAACVSQCQESCLNGGVCLTDDICSCPSGFVGKRCQHAACVLPCLNGGTCVAPYKCSCLPGYKGSRCQTPVCSQNCGILGKCIGPNVCLCQYGEVAESCPEYDYYDDYSQQLETQFNDWDLAYLQRRAQPQGQ